MNAICYFRKYCILQIFKLCRGKARKDPIGCIHILGTTNTNFDTSQCIASHFCDNISKSILSSVTSFFSIPHFSKLHINIIRENENIAKWNLIKMRNRTNRITRKIHIGDWFYKKNIWSLRNKCLESRVLPILSPKSFLYIFHCQKSHIMSRMGIFFSRITESDDHFHIRQHTNSLFFSRNSPQYLHKKKDCANLALCEKNLSFFEPSLSSSLWRV